MEESTMRAHPERMATVGGACAGSRVTLLRGFANTKYLTTSSLPAAACSIAQRTHIFIGGGEAPLHVRCGKNCFRLLSHQQIHPSSNARSD